MLVINSNLWYPCGQDVEILSKELIADNPWRKFRDLCVWIVFSSNIWVSSFIFIYTSFIFTLFKFPDDEKNRKIY